MTTKIMVVGSAKDTRKPKPRIRITGFWLNEFGFTCDSLAVANYEPGQINIKLQGSGLDTYKQVVKGVLENQGGLLQIKTAFYSKKRAPHIEIKGNWLEDFGFKIGSVFVVQADHGVITIRLLDMEKL